MRITMAVSMMAAILIVGTACFGPNDGTTQNPAATTDIDATITAGIATAVAQETGSNEATAPVQSQMTVTPVSSSGQTNWLDGLSQFHRIKVARDEVECVGYDSGRYSRWSHPIIRVDDGFYALGNPGEAVVFFDNDSGCRIGVITDENLE